MKDFEVLWACGADLTQKRIYHEAGGGERYHAVLSCQPPATGDEGDAGDPTEAGIRIVSATYGATCGVSTGNVTDIVARKPRAMRPHAPLSAAIGDTVTPDSVGGVT